MKLLLSQFSLVSFYRSKLKRINSLLSNRIRSIGSSLIDSLLRLNPLLIKPKIRNRIANDSATKSGNKQDPGMILKLTFKGILINIIISNLNFQC